MTGSLIGRDAELAVLRDLIDGMEDEGASVLLRGQPGMGKSSILQATASMAHRRGAAVLWTSGIDSQAMEPFTGLRQLLGTLQSHHRALPGVQRLALATALGAREGPPPELFLTALAALTLVVDAAASQPVVLLIDDLQWLDAATIEVLAFISRRLRQDPVVMISALRDGHAVALGGAEVKEIVLEGLDASSARRLLQSMTDGLTSAGENAVLSQARGNPLALVELPLVWRSAGRDLLAPGADAVPLTLRLEQAFAARISDLPPLTRDAVLIAAVDAEEKLAEVLAATTELAGTQVTTEHLEPAVRARLLDFDEVEVRFRHPLIRSGVLHNEPLRRRQQAHAALSQVLGAEQYRQVWHLAQSADAPDDEVAARLDQSHAESMRRGSVLGAIAALERSAQLTSGAGMRARRLLLAARHAFGLGRVDLVGRLVDAAETNHLCEADRARAEWLRELFSEGELGDSARIRELCGFAARSATSGDIDVALDLLASAALRCWWAAGDARDREFVVRVARDLTAMQDDARCISVIAVADPLGQVARTARRLQATAATGVSDSDQLRLLGMAARAIGADPLAADYFGAAETKLRERGQLGLLSQVLAVQAAVHLDLGNWLRAGQNLEEGRQLSEETGQSTWRTGTAVVGAVYEALTGSTEHAFQHAAEVETSCADSVAGDFRSLVQLARGVGHLSDGRPADAFAALLPIFDPSGSCHHPREQLSAVMFVAEAAIGCGEVDEARELLARLEVIARTSPSPILMVHLLYVRAVLAPDSDAEMLFKHGLAQDLTRWPWPRARLELAYGNHLKRRRRLVDARLVLRSALATFDTVGAVGWSRQARAALRASGDRTSATVDPGPDRRMTAQEMQIARLAAGGLSNREIGQQLYLSPRTVGSHLYRIFPKLGVTSRTQLAEHMLDS